MLGSTTEGAGKNELCISIGMSRIKSKSPVSFQSGMPLKGLGKKASATYLSSDASSCPMICSNQHAAFCIAEFSAFCSFKSVSNVFASGTDNNTMPIRDRSISPNPADSAQVPALSYRFYLFFLLQTAVLQSATVSLHIQLVFAPATFLAYMLANL